MTRIVVVEPNGDGGLIHYAYQLCTALADAGADVTLLTSTDYELAGLPHRFTVEPILRLWWTIESRPRRSRVAARVARLGRKMRRVGRGVRFAIAWQRATRRILEIDPDVAQFGVIRFPFQMVFLRRLRRAGITLAQVCHEFERRDAGPLTRWINRCLSLGIYRCFDLVFLHSRGDADRFLARFPVDPSVIRVIPHGNETLFVDLADGAGDLRDRYGIDPSIPVVLFFGGLRPSKGVPDLIDAFALVLGEVRAHLLIAGPAAGMEPAVLEEQVARLGVTADTTIDARYVPLAEVGPLMHTATVVALPYRSATASGVLQVAYAFGRPVVATALGSLTTDVEHGRTGLLVPPRDPAALAAALVEVISDPAAGAAMGARARDLATDRYAWDTIAATVLTAYADTRR